MMQVNELAVAKTSTDVMERAKRWLSAALSNDIRGVSVERLHMSYDIDGDTQSVRMTVKFQVPADE